MPLIYLNTVSREFFDATGTPFADGFPRLAYKRKETFSFQLCVDTPNAGTPGVEPEAWTKDTKFNLPGITALLSVDKDFLRRRKGTLASNLSAGEVSVVSASIANASTVFIRPSGAVRIFNSQGGSESLQYSSVEVTGNSVVFTLAEGSVLENSYTAGAVLDAPDALYMQAALDIEKSDPATGLFVFELIADSAKLREVMEYSDVRSLSEIAGMELLLFTVEEDATTERDSFLCNTLSLTGTIAEVGGNAQIPDVEKNNLAAMISAVVGYGVVFQFSVDGSEWHDTQADGDVYFRMRSANISTAEWSGAIRLIQGPVGNSGTLAIGEVTTGTEAKVENVGTDTAAILDITLPKGDKGATGPAPRLQYSADGVNYHDTLASDDKYIRFSTDEGVTWSAGVQFVGSNAPTVQIEYSATAGSGTWHTEKASDDIYIRFSVDGGTNWTGAMQAVAFPVKFLYGSTATDTFHADYVSGVDKYMKMSVDGGNTWGSAILFCGEDGQSFVPDATGALADRTAYDAEKKGFAYLVTSGDDAGKIYFKTADDSGSWSDGLQFTPFGVAIQYSADNASWHTSQQDGDAYIRYSVDGGDTWSAGSRFAGVSAYTYYAYAADTAGNGFALAPATGLKFRNEIHTATVYATADLTAALFASDGIGWYQYAGEDGVSYKWLSGTSVPADTLGEDGYWYINIGTADVYERIEGAWVYRLTVTGPKGDKGDPGKQGEPGQALEANYVEVSSASNGYITVPDETVPVSVEIDGVVYAIEDATLLHVDDTFRIPVAPFLAAANLASFSGTWRVWRAGGKQGLHGGTFVIEVVTALPETPDTETLYLIPEA